MTTAAPTIPPVPRSRHFYPVATTGRPHPLWYFGWAAYVNRYGYLRALAVGLPVAVGLAAVGVAFRLAPLLAAAGVLAAGGFAVFAFSLLGMSGSCTNAAVRNEDSEPGKHGGLELGRPRAAARGISRTRVM